EALKFAGDFYHFKLPAGESAAFTAVGNEVGATLYINLMAALNVLMFKYTGRMDIVVGSSIAGRSHADLRDIVGMFVNMLAIRNRPEPDMTYPAFVQNVKTTVLEAFENQDMQFEILAERLNLPAGGSRNPLFDVCLNVQNYEQPEFEVEGLTFSPFDITYKNAKFDMLLWANPVEDEIEFMLEYSTELFKPSTAEQFSNHLLEILTQVGRDKSITLGDINLSHRLVNPTAQAPQIDFDF
ncbi:MAG: polyketide synthase, partial [bacterium]|nr:polyketide synthase [bacterium]